MGKKPIPVSKSVKVGISGQTVSVEGPKGKMQQQFDPSLTVTYDSGSSEVKVDRSGDDRQSKSLHGLTHSLISNMIYGVTEGYSKTLEIFGTGYGAKIEGQDVVLTVGFSHGVHLKIPDGVEVNIEVPTARGNDIPARLVVQGVDKQKVGDFASKIRRVRPPEPYHGKGIRYAGEYVRRKEGKAFASSAK
jgi:large subunit ribosomal protein L6